MAAKIIVVGGVAAGMSAAAKARRTDLSADIVVYTDSEHISYAGCGLPYFVGGRIKDKNMLFAKTIEDFAKQNIRVKILSKAEKIIPDSKRVVVNDLQTGASFDDYYDRLIIAAGARPFVPPMDGIDLNGVFPLRTVVDSLNIIDFLKREQPKKIAIIGGGYIGLEMAENFLELGCSVSIIEKAPHIVPNMDEDMTDILHRYLESMKIEIYTDTTVIGFVGDKTVNGVITDKGSIPADFVLLSIGVLPNSELAASAGIELGAKNAIRINGKSETNIKDIFAAGDCATAKHLVSGMEVYIPLGTTANKQGKVAGENAAGGSAFFKGVIGTGIARVMQMEISRTGLGEFECKALGINYISRRIKAATAAHYCPVSGEINLKLIAEADSRRLIGAQIVGYSGAAMRIDMLATAITVGATIEQLTNMDLAYSPPFSPVWDPVLVALNQF